VQPLGVQHRLRVLASGAVAIEVKDVPGEAAERLEVHLSVAGVALRADVLLDPRQQDRKGRGDAEYLEVVVLARPGREAVRGDPIIGQVHEGLAVVVRFWFLIRCADIAEQERRPPIAEVDVQQSARARRPDGLFHWVVPLVHVGLSRKEGGQRLTLPVRGGGRLARGRGSAWSAGLAAPAHQGHGGGGHAERACRRPGPAPHDGPDDNASAQERYFVEALSPFLIAEVHVLKVDAEIARPHQGDGGL
jgi:hypothetical protein